MMTPRSTSSMHCCPNPWFPCSRAMTVRPGIACSRPPESTRLEKLLESGEGDIAARRHAECFAKLLQAHHGGQIDLEYTGRAHALREHLGNVRAALDWCFAQHANNKDSALAVDLAAAAAPMFYELSLLSEAYKWSDAGLAALDESTRGGRRELLLRSTWAISAMWLRGSDDVLSAIARGMELAPIDEPAQRMRLLATRHLVLTRKADHRGALEAAADWDVAARQVSDGKCLAISDLMQGVARHMLGNQSAAQRLFDAGFARAGDRSLQLCGIDHRVRGLVTSSRVQWLSGFPDRAVNSARQAVAAAISCGRSLDTCFALIFTTPVYLWCGAWDAAQQVLDQLVKHTHWQLLKPFHPTAHAMGAATLIGRGDTGRGNDMMAAIQEKLRAQSLNVVGTFVACFVAEGLIAAGRADEAVTLIRRARRGALRGGEAVQLPELLRVQAKALLSISPANEARTVRLLERSCRIARHQSAPSWELRSATDLAHIHVRRGEYDCALRLLAPIYSRFTEGFETQDLQSARRMLREIEIAQGAVTSAHVDGVAHGATLREVRTSAGADTTGNLQSQASSSPH